MFVFFRQLYTIYERLIKAKQIINTLVEQELKLKNDENLTKKEAEIKKEKFEIYLTGLLSAIGQLIDTNKYEDFTRYTLGNKAYLLFSFDKLIISVSLLNH